MRAGLPAGVCRVQHTFVNALVVAPFVPQQQLCRSVILLALGAPCIGLVFVVGAVLQVKKKTGDAGAAKKKTRAKKK